MPVSGGATIYRDKAEAPAIQVGVRDWSVSGFGFISPVAFTPGESILVSWVDPAGELSLNLYSVARCRARRNGYTIGASLLTAAGEQSNFAA